MLILFALSVFIAAGVAAWMVRRSLVIVPEDHAAVIASRHGFITRTLPAGRHFLRPFERIELTIPTKTRLVAGQARAIATGDGIPVQIEWSGIFAANPQSITESRSQRLRALPHAERAIHRNADILLRRYIGGHTARDLFDPAVRDRLERQLNHLLADRLNPLGIVFKSINLQTIELPAEVSEALAKATALETLDGAIRHLDPATREVVRGVYQLEEVLRWDHYLPAPSRRTVQRLAVAG
ncbi:MAG: SPFH domain-containing protein [Chloroflexi bacterium]|nr:MAG: SPFH domain-containing protein [Chloroflexota bacterium]